MGTPVHRGPGLHYELRVTGASVLPPQHRNTEPDRADDGPGRHGHSMHPVLPHPYGRRGRTHVHDFRRTPCSGVLCWEQSPDRGHGSRIENGLGINAYDIYGTSELAGPMFTECTERKGLHIWGYGLHRGYQSRPMRSWPGRRGAAIPCSTR